MVPEGWTAKKIGDLATFSSGGTPSKSEASYWGGGEPWISGKDLKTHYLSKSVDTLTDKGFVRAKRAPKGSTLILVRGMTLLKDFPVGYATREVAFNQDIKALLPKGNVDGLFLSFLLAGEQDRIKRLVSTAGHGTGRLDTQLVKEYPVDIPPLGEQQKIAKILSTWDEAIATTEQLLANSEQQKKALMQQLLTGKKRLPGFEGEWEHIALGKLFSERKETGIAGLSLLSVTSDQGVINRDDVGRKDTSSADKSRYLRVCPGDIAYNTMRMWQGVSALSGLEGIVSPAYTVLKPESAANSQFFAYLFKLPGMVHRFYRHSQGLVSDTWNLKYKQFARIKVLVPGLKEQEAIAEVLSKVDETISCVEEQLENLAGEKKVLMQQLLTGKRRVKVDEAERATA